MVMFPLCALRSESPRGCALPTLTVLSLFFFLSPFLEVISQTAQAFLPAYSKPPKNADAASWRAAADSLATRLLRYAVIVSTCAAIVGVAVPLGGTALLTNDATVRAAVRPLAVPLGVATLLTGPVCAAEGVLLARRRLRFLAAIYLSSVAVLPPVLLAVKRGGGPVWKVWACFAVFQAFRAIVFSARIWGAAAWRAATNAISRVARIRCVEGWEGLV